MVKKQKIVLPVAVLIIGVLLLGAVFYVINSKKESPENATIANPQTTEEIKSNEKSIEDFETIKGLYSTKKYQEVIDEAQKYGETSNNSESEKLNSFYLCIKAAYVLKNTQAVATCESNIRKILLTMEAQDAEPWDKLIEAAKNGEKPNDGSDGQQEI